MQPKTIGKRSVDLAMTLLLLLLMARQITGETAHEWLGAGMFALWVAHHALNASWHRRLFRGRCASWWSTCFCFWPWWGPW